MATASAAAATRSAAPEDGYPDTWSGRHIRRPAPTTARTPNPSCWVAAQSGLTVAVDKDQLETKVKDMHRHGAEEPHGRCHFELGKQVALRAGYGPDRLRAVPADAVESFAGVGYFFDLADLELGETVVDLGSGSGMDACNAAGLVGPTGRVVGVDFTPEQLDKARRIAASAGLGRSSSSRVRSIVSRSVPGARTA